MQRLNRRVQGGFGDFDGISGGGSEDFGTEEVHIAGRSQEGPAGVQRGR